MEQEASSRYHAGDRVDDLCRACKLMREHTVFSVDGEGRILRVVCDYCKSHHNWRGGDTAHAPAPAGRQSAGHEPLSLVSERERRYPPMSLVDPQGQSVDVEILLRRVLREELGLTPVAPAEKWRGGEMVLKPANAGLQERSWPIETLLHKMVMIRNKLRVLEQQVGTLEIPEAEKVKLQGYITGCYGSLTSFNLLFADEDDKFKGAGGKD